MLMNIKLIVILVSYLLTASAFAQTESSASAKQIVEKFQSDLIAVMKEGKQLGYAGRYEKLKEADRKSVV